MGNVAKIRHIWKKKFFRVMVIIEVMMAAAGIVGLFGKNAVYEFGVGAMQGNFGTQSEEGFFTADGTEGIKGNLVDFTGISLPRGTYRVQMHYATDTDMKNGCEVTDSKIGQGNLRTNGAQLFSGLEYTDFDMWLLRDSKEMIVHAYYDGEGRLEVQGLTIRQTNAWNRILLFCMICLFTAVNCAYCYVQYDREYGIPVKKRIVTFSLGLVILFASYPLMVDYMVSSGDLGYHLMRVEGIKDGLLNGQFPIRISPEWQQGYGYASPIFYGETLLYPAGLLRMIGFTVTTSYRIYMFGVTAATVLIAYYSFKKIFREAYIGVFCSMLYTFSVYRIYKTYCTGSWGEVFGIMLLPLLVCGFYGVFAGDVGAEGYKKSWAPLTAGFALLVQSHLLTGEMAGLFTIILCVILWKKVFRPRTFLVLAKTVVYSVLLSAWFLIPFADYMATGDFVIHHVSGRTIQYRGLFPAHLLFTYFVNGSTVFFDESGMYDSAATGLGIAPVVALGIFAYLLWAGKMDGGKKAKTEKTPGEIVMAEGAASEGTVMTEGAASSEGTAMTEGAASSKGTVMAEGAASSEGTAAEGVAAAEKGLGKIAAGIALAAMIMSLSLFPWDAIQSWSGLTATLVSSIQFPNRFLTIANVCLTAVAGVAAKYFMGRKNRMFTACYFGGMAFLLVLSSVHLMEDMLNRAAPVRVYNNEGMGTGYISGGEYLPYGAEASQLMYHDPVCTGALKAEDYEKLSLGAVAYLSNPGVSEESAAFGLLYYKGYHAYAVEDGRELECYAGENFQVTVDIPSGFEGAVRVEFVSPWYWRVGELMSVLFFAGMLLEVKLWEKWKASKRTSGI